MSNTADQIPPIAPPNQFRLAIADLVEGLKSWRIWTMLARNDVAQRYRRSRLGEFWLTLSMAVTIVAIGAVYSTIFKIDTAKYIPFLACGLVSWTFLNTLVSDLALAFISSADTIRNYRKPLSIAIFRTIARNVILFGHNLVIVPAVLLFYAVPVTPALLLLPLALLIYLVLGIGMGILLATLSARFRDLPPVITNIMQLMFFVTPIMFTPQLLIGRWTALTVFNPFANLIEIMRAPMLGEVPDGVHYAMVGLVTAAVWIMALWLYTNFRRRVIYWL